jgi:hypothetical protein
MAMDEEDGMKRLSSVGSGSVSKSLTSRLQKLLDERISAVEAMQLATRIVASYPNADRTGEGYLGSLAAILRDYPAFVARQAAELKNGIARYNKFLPTVADLVSYCEGFTEPLRRQADVEARRRAQFADREAFERQQTIERKQRLDYAALKDKFGDWHDSWRRPGTKAAEIAAAARAKLIAEFGEGAFDAIPDAAAQER